MINRTADHPFITPLESGGPSPLQGRSCPITQPRLHHLAITVTDLEASVQWYESVFDLIRPRRPAPGRRRPGSRRTDRQLMIALHRHDTNDGRLFTETVNGLDHGGFAVSSRRDLEHWQEHLEANGVVRADTADSHSPSHR